MKKMACALLFLISVIALINPLAGEARGGHWGGWGWWAPWAVVGGAAVLAAPYYGGYYAPYYYPPYYPYYPPHYYEPYYAPPPVVIQRQAPAAGQPGPPVPTERIFIYPRQGQTEKQQADDRYECHRWAVGQTGFDPTQLSGETSEAASIQKRADYYRAPGACLDGRGYTMR